MSIQCFFLEPVAGKFSHQLRRYRPSDENNKCPLPHGYHDATVILGHVDRPDLQRGCGGRPDDAMKLDPRWPKLCACGYVFDETDTWQENFDGLYRRSDTGEVITLREATVGAIWNASWMPGAWKNPQDGRCLIARIPNDPGGVGQTDWNIDGKCSNCTRPGEKHQCWIRHGEPPNLHVDKNGETCSAGAGSIMAHGGWHGFLHNGCLVTC